MKNSVQLKLKLDLNSDLGRNLFAGISEALAGSETSTLEVKQVIVLDKEEVTDTAAPVVEKPKRAPRAATKPEGQVAEENEKASDKLEEAAPEVETPAAEATTEEVVEEKGTPIVLGDIKAEIAKKVSKHRDAIKAELTRLGAENSDKMPKEHYPAFHKFLTEL